MAATGNDANGQNFDNLILEGAGDRARRRGRRIGYVDGTNKICAQRRDEDRIGILWQRSAAAVENLRIDDLRGTHNDLHRRIAITAARKVHNDYCALACGEAARDGLEQM